MFKKYQIKILPLIFLLIFNFVEIKAVESFVKTKKQNSEKMIQNKKKYGDGFFKKISRKVKRFFSKRKARKNRTKGNLKERNKNLFNILMFSLIFIPILAGLIALYMLAYISYPAFLITLIILLITTTVIALVYFSGRYIIKPHYKS